jgi:FlaA1/EpsC-like NDP-sugar epimerase
MPAQVNCVSSRVAVTTASVLTSGVMLTSYQLQLLQPGMPRSALGIDWLLSLVLIGGSRFALRILAEQYNSRARKDKTPSSSGQGMLARSLCVNCRNHPNSILFPVGFLDDDPAKQNHQIYGVSVIGKSQQDRICD